MTTTETPERLFLRYRQGGDLTALAAVFDRTAPQLLLLAAHVTPDVAAAEDLLQDTFLHAMEKAAQWDPTRPLLPWLGGILRHRALDLTRRLRLRSSATPLEAIEVASAAAGPAEAAAAQELIDRVTAALEALQSPFREALVLRIVHGLEPTEIAHALGRPPTTVRVQLRRGLEVLRGVLPASLAGALVLVLQERGLAATRAAVLAGAGGGAGALVALTAPSRGGWLVAALLVLALGAGWWWHAASTAAPTRTTGVLASPAPAPLAAAGASDLRVGEEPPRTPVMPAAVPVATATLRGRIVGVGDRAPLAGGSVQVRFSAGRFVSEDPDVRPYPAPVHVGAAADGTFAVTFTPEAETRVSLEVRAPGRAPAAASWTSIRSGIDVDLGDVALWPGCLFRGRVVDEHGEPVPGVMLEIERRSGGVAEAGSLFAMWNSFDVESGADGGLPDQILPAPAIYAVGVSFRRPGWKVVRPTELAVDATPIVTDITVARPAADDSLSGRVVDAQGNPVAGVTLCLEPEMLEMGSATSGAGGDLRLPIGIVAQTFALHLPATERGYRLLEPEREYRRGATGVEVRVARQPVFDVPVEVVRAADGQPVTDYGLRCVLDYWTEDMQLSMPPERTYRPAPAAAHHGGRAVLRGLHPGSYRLSVFPNDVTLATSYLQAFTVGGDGASSVRVELHGHAPLRVVLRDDTGAPLPDVEVRLVHTMLTGGSYSGLFSVEQFARGIGGGRDTAVALQTARTDAAGAVALRAPVDEPRLGLQLAGPRVAWQRRGIDAVPASGNELRLSLPAMAQLRGRVGPAEFLLRVGPSAPVLRAAAMVREEDSDLLNACPKVFLVGADGSPAGSAPLLPDGTFDIDAAKPGDGRLMLSLDYAMDSGFYTADDLAIAEVRSLRAGEVRELSIDASKFMPARLRGAVVVDGAPWTRGEFGLLTSEPGTEQLFRVELGPDGQFDRVMRPGRYLPCAVWEDGAGEHILCGLERRELAPGSDQQLHFVFEHRVLRIAVLRADGSAAAGQALRVEPVDFPEAVRAFGAACKAGDDGVVVFDPSPPGRVQLFVPGSDGASLGEVAAGTQPVTTVTLRLPQ